MPTIQYTIRNISSNADRYYRKRAALSGKSLNQVILDKLNDIPGAMPTGGRFDWLIGSGLDKATDQALADLEASQKALAKKLAELDTFTME